MVADTSAVIAPPTDGAPADVFEPSILTEAGLTNRMNNSLHGATDERREIAQQLAQMALEARQNYESARGRVRRALMEWGSWSYSSLSAVVSAAVGGTVLALNELPGWVRYAVAAIALLAAAIGALNPARYYSEDRHRNLQYYSFHRWTWQYILTELPTAEMREAQARLYERSAALDSIRGVQPPPWGRASHSSGIGPSKTGRQPTAPTTNGGTKSALGP